MKKWKKVLLFLVIILITMPILKNAFNDVKRKSLPQIEGKIGGEDYLDRVAGMQIGEGTKVFRSDQSGLWLGASQFTDAPFSVDMLGALNAKSATFKDGDDTTIIDAGGLVSTASFTSDTVHVTADQTITSTSKVDVTNVTLTTPNFTRDTNVLILYTAIFSIGGNDANSFVSNGILSWNIDDAEPSESIEIQKAASYDSGTGETVSNLFTTTTLHHMALLGSGTHVIKLEGQVANTVGAGRLTVFESRLTYIILGN